MRKWPYLLSGLVFLTLAHQTNAAGTTLFPGMPTNRWVPVQFRCKDGLKSYADGCPSGRSWIQLIYDSKRHKVVLFGGSGEWYFNDLWYFDPGSRVWQMVLQDSRLAGTKMDASHYPTGRDNHQLAYDSEHDVYWMYGGTGGGGFWKFVPNRREWIRMPGVHDGRQLPVAALDPGFSYAADLGKIFLFGGEGNTFHDTTWVFDTREERWSMISTHPSPPPRAQLENGMIYDSKRKQLIMFGGMGINTAMLGDTWVFDVANKKWTDMQPKPSPPPRNGHIIVFDQKNEVALMWGGAGTADTWVYEPDANTWHEITTARGGYEAASARLGSGVYLPDADSTLFRDVKGNLYFFRLDMKKLSSSTHSTAKHNASK